MTDILVRADSKLHIEGLNPTWVNGLSELVSVKNEAKNRAIKEHVWNAHKLPDKLTLAEHYKDTLSLPRGFFAGLESRLKDTPYNLKLDDHMVRAYYDDRINAHIGKSANLTEEQFAAFAALINHDQGRLIMPPGKGKTVVGLSLIQHSYVKTLIIVQQKHIAQQWIDRGKEHFDLDIGMIGDNRWEEKDITVALVQTLWSRREDLDMWYVPNEAEVGIENWWSNWGMVILDEQHHIPAETVMDIVQRFPALRRYGFSATVGKTEADKKISELIFGPILYESKEVNVKPVVRVVDTNWDFEYKPTKEYIKPNGKKGIRRNNYKDLIKALVNDEDRNEMIANQICSEPTKCHLVVSDRLAHFDEIQFGNGRNIDDVIDVYILTGKQSLEERMKVYEKANAGECVIFSTVASEALDIPRIDRVHLVYPRRNIEAIWQIIGRACRDHPEKTESVIIDYRDKCSILRNQFNTRARDLYKPKNITVQLPQNTSIPLSPGHAT